MRWRRRPPRRQLAAAAGLLVVLLGGSPGTAGPPASTRPPAEEIGSIQVLMSPAQALALAFPAAERIEALRLAVDDSLRAVVAQAGRDVAADSVALYIAHAAEAILGYAVIGDEIGKYRPITFLVATDAQLRVTRVAVLVYRESRGGQVRRSRFLRQYRGKDIHDDIRINRDIVNITGATLSVRALNAGVRKALLLLEAFHARPGGMEMTAGP